MALRICITEIATLVCKSDLTFGSHTILNVHEDLSKIECFNNSMLCAIGTKAGNTLIFNASSN